MSCYWLFTITIIATYSGNLVAFMTVKKVKLPIDTLEELAARPEYQAGLKDGSSTSELFKVRFFNIATQLMYANKLFHFNSTNPK